MKMKKPLKRICIYPKDVQKVTGKSERYSREILKKVKRHYNKPEHQFLTAEEFCSYVGIPIESMEKFLND